jgi:hypothetical protein
VAETKYERLQQLHTAQKLEVTSQMFPHWRDLSEHVLPRRSRFLVSDVNKGDRRNLKIIDPTATLASRTQRAGMFTGITSPARPWFRLQTPDPGLMESYAVKDWLRTVEDRMRTAMLRSNLYNALPILFGDIGTFATGAFVLLEDARSIFRCYPLAIGSYTLAQNDSLRVDTLTREYTMTVRQAVEAFGIDKVSPTTQSLYRTGKYGTLVEITHVVGPNLWRDNAMKGARDKPVHSCYFETKGDGQRFLRESGFDEFPVMAPRWEVTGEDVYGSECPGMVCIGDVKALQLLHKRKAQANEKMLNPPLSAPTSMKNAKISQIPGDVTYIDTREGQQGLRSIYETKFDTRPILEDIKDHQVRISRAYYEDLFLMLAQSDRREITAREIEERHEEKLLMLGPVLERLNSELLDPLIDRIFNIMVKQGRIPEPPEELSEMDLKVEYISIMAQAQKLLSANSIERFATFAGSLAQLNPEALDKFDMDQALDEYGSITGAPPNIVRSDEDTAAVRENRAQANAKAQQLALGEQAAANAKTLSETDTTGENALTQILGTQAA